MWQPARLGSIGAIGDAALAGSCIQSSDGSGDLLCGGIRFPNLTAAIEWPGEALSRGIPSINNLPDKVFPVSFPLWDLGPGPFPYVPAATPNEAKITGVVGPATLTSALPQITPLRQDRVDSAATGFACSVQSWASANPVLALLTAVGVYYMVRGK